MTGRPWREGAMILRDGYAYVRVAMDHRHANSLGYAPAHLVIAERLLGRPLRGQERVRRLAFYRHDNRPTTLLVSTPDGFAAVVDLAIHERRARGLPLVAPCARPTCEATIDLTAGRGRLGTCSEACSDALASVPPRARSLVG